MSLKIYLLLGQCIILCSHFDTSNALVGANVRSAKAHEFRAIVAIMYNSDREQEEEDYLCTGTLISQEHVLTASHCLQDIDYKVIAVIIGSRNYKRGKKYLLSWVLDYVRWATARYVPLQYEVDDILIMKLSKKVSRSLPIPDISSTLKQQTYGKIVQTAGWGDDGQGRTPLILQVVNLTVLSNTDCSSKLHTLIGKPLPMPERFMCTHAEPYALMQYGDSGCPIFYNEKIVAIHKSAIPFPDQPLHPQKLNIHSAIEYYEYYISDVINSNDDWSQ